MNELPVNRAQIGDTYESIAPYIRMTPTVEIAATDLGLADFRCIFKLEFMQHAGSFKARGAFAHLLRRRIPDVGVVAASGGNHGAAVGFAAQRLNRLARIYVPSVASAAKLARIRESGAELVVGGERYADALEASRRWAAESGALPLHAYDEPETLLGQGTVGLEWEDQVPDLDTVLLAVGGGGLLGGVAAWYEDRVRLIGVEPESAPTLTAAIAAGQPVDAPAGGIAADSLAPRQVGQLMFPIAQRFVERVVLVPDEAIRQAQALLWERLRLVTEPGGAAAFAALLCGRYQPAPGERVGILLCGANTTAVDLR